jgi:YHS domain-containing protein
MRPFSLSRRQSCQAILASLAFAALCAGCNSESETKDMPPPVASHAGYPAVAAPVATPAATTAKPAAIQSAVCPITGEKIADVSKAAGHSDYKGKTYYFCCPSCKPKFDKDPAKFVANAAKGKFENTM